MLEKAFARPQRGLFTLFVGLHSVRFSFVTLISNVGANVLFLINGS